MDFVDRLNLELQLVQRGKDDVALNRLLSWWRVFSSNQEVFNAIPRAREYIQCLPRWLEDNLTPINVPETARFRQQQSTPLPEPQ